MKNSARLLMCPFRAFVILLFSISFSFASDCDEYEISLTGFIPNTPFFSLYNAFYDINSRKRRDYPDIDYLASFSPVLENSFNRPDFIENIILRPSRYLFSKWFVDQSMVDKIPKKIGPFRIHVIVSSQKNIVSTKRGDIYISTGILFSILESTLVNSEAPEHLISSAIQHYISCSPYNDLRERNDVFFTIRYLDEYIRGVILFMFLHEIAHFGFGHFDIHPENCDWVNELEAEADIMAFNAYLEMLNQLLSADDSDPAKIKAVHFTPYGLLDIAKLAFSKNADIELIAQTNSKCEIKSPSERAEYATGLMKESIDGIFLKLKPYNQFINSQCKTIKSSDLRDYCKSRISRIPKILQ